jgi:hypothetical protein
MTQQNQPAPERKPPEQLTFHFIKTPDYRTIHVDGATGGVTPHGLIHMALYSEHAAIPQRTTHLMKGYRLGEEDTSERVTRGGVVRDINVSLFMAPSVAKGMAEWLLKRLAEIDQAQQEAEEEAQHESGSQ